MAFAGSKKEEIKKFESKQISLSLRDKERLISLVKTLLPDSSVSIGYISNSVNPMYGFLNIDGEFVHWYEFCVNHLPKVLDKHTNNNLVEIQSALFEEIKKGSNIIDFYYKNFINTI